MVRRPGGEIGRRTGLKIPGRKACGFESRPGHHQEHPTELDPDCDEQQAT
jgi:hypothetical protein